MSLKDFTALPAVQKAKVGRVYVEKSPRTIIDWLNKMLPHLDRPEVLASWGDEINTVHRSWNETDFRACWVSSMRYQSSAGNLSIPLLYHQSLEQGPTSWLIDRAYFWESPRNFKRFKDGHIPIFGLQTRRSLSDFDFLGFSCSYLYSLVNVGTMLRLSGIPPRAANRSELDPLVVVGGHSTYLNNEVVWQIPDLVWVGEFSPSGMDMVRSYYEARKAGVKKWDWLREVAKRGDSGYYVPSFYREVYSEQAPYPILRRESLVEGIPTIIHKAYAHNLAKDYYVPGAPIVPYVDPGMGATVVQTSLGCPAATCTFCSEGQNNKPFRWFSVPFIVRKATEIYRNTGLNAITLSAFDGAGHPLKRHLIRRLLEGVSDEVTLLSLRVDETADDPIFSAMSTVAGNKTLSLGIEGMSERMRRVYLKHCTEEQILSVCRAAIGSGARKIKFFLISNHPWETREDRWEWIETLKKIQAIKEELRAKTIIISSWTALCIMPGSPLQWEAPQVNRKELGELTDALKKQTGTNYRIGPGSRYDEALLSHVLWLGDRRVADSLVNWMLDNDWAYFGAVSRGFYETAERELAKVKAPGPISSKTWMRSKPYSEFLPWDFMDVGADREWLIMANEISHKGGVQLAACAQGCTFCGACTEADRAHIQSGFKMKDEDVSLDDIHVIQQRGRAQVVRLKVQIDRDHRFIGSEYWIAGLKRACRLADLPVDKSRAEFVVQHDKNLNYAYGVDYADLSFLSRVEVGDLVSRISPNLPAGISVLSAKSFSPNVMLFRNTVDSVHYVVDTRANFTLAYTKEHLETFLGSLEFIALIRRRFFKKGVVAVPTDIRNRVRDAWIQPSGMLHILLDPRSNPYEIVPAILGTSSRKTTELDIVRADIYLKVTDDGQIDAFRARCKNDNMAIPPNLLDETDSDLCPRDRYEHIDLTLMPTGRVVSSATLDDLADENAALVADEELSDERLYELNSKPYGQDSVPEPSV